MEAWKKGAVIGGIIGVIVIISLVIVTPDTAFIVALFFPDFIIGGSIIGYIYERYIQK
jgi:hypothetical protein